MHALAAARSRCLAEHLGCAAACACCSVRPRLPLRYVWPLGKPWPVRSAACGSSRRSCRCCHPTMRCKAGAWSRYARQLGSRTPARRRRRWHARGSMRAGPWPACVFYCTDCPYLGMMLRVRDNRFAAGCGEAGMAGKQFLPGTRATTSPRFVAKAAASPAKRPAFSPADGPHWPPGSPGSGSADKSKHGPA